MPPHRSHRARPGFRLHQLPGSTAVFALPEQPPPVWFGVRISGPEDYAAKQAWALVRIARVEAACLPDVVPVPAHLREIGQAALLEILADPVAYWITCCWAAHETVRALSGPLPLEPGFRYGFIPEAVPQVLRDMPHLNAVRMSEHAAGFLTAVFHDRLPLLPTGSDYGTRSWRLMLCVLLDAAGHALVGYLPHTVQATADPSVLDEIAELDRLAAIVETPPKPCAACRTAGCVCTRDTDTGHFPCFHCGATPAACADVMDRDAEKRCCWMCEVIWSHERHRPDETAAVAEVAS